ncbi:MAG: recombination protein O N-terminal domain-containing protein [Candidatus Pacebacteria bacterium]|nr:recombination protein O N-terminal domain-containing protein [Candidatus Paceibacterota bacterium]
MRHKYDTRGIVLSRSPIGESSSFVTLLTPELGLVRALAQSVRKSNAKLASSLVTFAESSVVLVRGRDGWRIAGAVLEENWFARVTRARAREAAVRVSGLLLRLVAGEAQEAELFPIMRGFLEALATLPQSEDESLEALAALRVLAALGLDAGEIPGEKSAFTPTVLDTIKHGRADYIARINRGIEASGL